MLNFRLFVGELLKHLLKFLLIRSIDKLLEQFVLLDGLAAQAVVHESRQGYGSGLLILLTGSLRLSILIDVRHERIRVLNR